MSEPVVRIEKSGEIATVTLNRPEALNALSSALRRSLAETFDALAEDEGTRVVVLTGAGRAFCAGVDLKELGQGGTASWDEQTAAAEHDVVRSMEALPQPVIGAINGFAVTGGFEIALACDLLIASTAARFSDTHARVGILPGWGLSQRLSRAIGIYRAKELSLTGNYLDAARAYDWGLVSRVVEPDELLPTCRSLAEDMLSCDARTVAGYKKVIDEGFASTFGDAMSMERRLSKEHSRSVLGTDVEGRRAGILARGRKQSGDA